MKTFSEYLPTMTAREREIVESFFYSGSTWFMIFRNLKMMRDTPPAKKPVSVEGIVDDPEYLLQPEWVCVVIDGIDMRKIKSGDRVRVVKIEEMK